MSDRAHRGGGERRRGEGGLRISRGSAAGVFEGGDELVLEWAWRVSVSSHGCAASPAGLNGGIKRLATAAPRKVAQRKQLSLAGRPGSCHNGWRSREDESTPTERASEGNEK